MAQCKQNRVCSFKSNDNNNDNGNDNDNDNDNRQ